MNAVKTNLKRLRLARGMTQDELAEKLHVVRQTVSSWETGKTTPDVETLTAIAEALGAEITELIYGVKPVDTFAASRTKRVRQAVLLIGIAAFLGWLDAFREDIMGMASAYGGHSFVVSWYLILMFAKYILHAAACMVTGAAAIAVVRTWRELTVPNRALRWGCILVGALPVLIYFGVVVAAAADVVSFRTADRALFDFNVENCIRWISRRQYLFFPSGILLALGVSRRT